MVRSRWHLRLPGSLLLAAAVAVGPLGAQTPPADSSGERLVGAMLGNTPLVRDLETLTDRFGGRPTGSAVNQQAFELGRRAVPGGRGHRAQGIVPHARPLARALRDGHRAR